MRALLEADLLHRSPVLAELGPVCLFGDLHPSIEWTGRELKVDQSWNASVESIQLDSRR